MEVAAVAAGAADSMSAHGEITEQEMEAAVRSMRERAIVVRGWQGRAEWHD
jgi:hypothetical protein